MTERAWRPEPPCDWLILTVSPVFFFQYSANDLLKSVYSSRVGSYETLSSVTSAACATLAGAADEYRGRSARSAAGVSSLSVPFDDYSNAN